MAVKKPVALYAGELEELRAGDTLPGGGGSVTITKVEIDFTTPSVSREFDVAFTGASAGQNVISGASLDMPAGISADELQMDPISVFARVKSTDVVTIMVASTLGTMISGKRNINLTLA